MKSPRAVAVPNDIDGKATGPQGRPTGATGPEGGPGVESGHWRYVTNTTVELIPDKNPTKKERSRATPGPN
jgi:hypothetical protein